MRVDCMSLCIGVLLTTGAQTFAGNLISNGSFGTTYGGGQSAGGTVFKLVP